MYQLVGQQQNPTINIIKDSIKIGRKVCDVLITNDATISRFHASLEFQNDTLKIQDQQSKHGIFVNDDKVNSKVLRGGDVVRLGQFETTFVVKRMDLSVCLSGLNNKKKVGDLALLKMIPVQDIDQCTLLVMDSIKPTKKVLIALCRGIHIVNPNYLTDLSITFLPRPEDYLPPVHDIDKTVLAPNRKRSELFQSIIFNR